MLDCSGFLEGPFHLFSRTILVLSVMVASVVATACQRSEPLDPGEWPQFRGPDGLGLSAAEPLPETWSEDSDNILWKTRIGGKGNSSPVVSHGRVFLTTSTQKGKARIEKWALGLDLETGEVLWKTLVETSSKNKRHHVNTWAAPTPVTDGTRVFVHFGDVLAALDRDGQILWNVVVDTRYVEFSHYGAGSSPVLLDGNVLVFQDRETVDDKPGWMAVFDGATGEEIWRTTWVDTCCSYITPTIRRRGEGTEVILLMAGSVRGFDSQTGEELWRQPFETDQPVASAVTEGDLLAVFSGAHTHRHGAVFELSGGGKTSEARLLWDTTRMIPQTSSPVLLNGLLFTLTEQGVLVCTDVRTGERLWKSRLPTGTYRSSLVAGDGKIFAVSSLGNTAVVAVAEKFDLLSNNTLAKGGNSSPALAANSIFIRTESDLYRIGISDTAGSS